MANAQVLYAESVAATTAATTTWVDLASIAAASFTGNKNYLIIANQICSHASATNEARARLVHGTTPTIFDDASLAYEGLNSTQEHELTWLYKYTQPGTTELVKLQISSSSTTTVTNILSQIIAINLDDLGTSGTDYFWNEFLTNYTLTNTPTAKAITSSFTPNGTDKWLFIGHMIRDVEATITTPIGFELYDSVAGVLNSCQQEGEDATNDFLGHNLYWVGVPSNAARTLAVRPFQTGGTPNAIMLASRVIAINLSKFAQSDYVFSATGVDPATTPTYTTVATVAPTPTATGNWVYIAFLDQDVNEITTEWETRLQVNPDGGGLVSDPNYATTPPSIDNWDATDIVPHSVFKLCSLTSGAARTINFDIRQVTGTTGRVTNNGLVAFSVELASGATNVPVSDSAALAETASPAANAPAVDSASAGEGTPNIAQAISDSHALNEAAPNIAQAVNDLAALTAETAETTAAIPVSDASAFTEAAPNIAQSISDSGALTESSGLALLLSVSDSASLTEAASLTAVLSASDTGSLTEAAPNMAQAVVDSATLTAEDAAISLSVAVNDSATLADIMNVSATLSAEDALVLAELFTLSATLTGSDAGSLSDLAVVGEAGAAPMIVGPVRAVLVGSLREAELVGSLREAELVDSLKQATLIHRGRTRVTVGGSTTEADVP